LVTPTEELRSTQDIADEALPPVSTTDGQLVQAALSGDLSAFGVLYDRYRRLAHVICYDYDITGDLHAAHDLVHEAFLGAYRNLGQLRKCERFGSWLLAIVHRKCRDWQRHRARDRHQFVGLNPGHGLRAADDSRERSFELLRRAIAQLPQKERVALHLFYLEENSAERARRLLDLSRSGFYRLLERARKRLRRVLADDEEVFS
jgi:RNA polymerase sigma-70 factor (ECF subfamily)